MVEPPWFAPAASGGEDKIGRAATPTPQKAGSGPKPALSKAEPATVGAMTGS